MTDRDRVLRQLGVSHETARRLDILAAELERWQKVKNLVGSQTLHEVWTRHILDSAQLFECAPKTRLWLDLGSGGGFPGLVLGILLTDIGGRIHLVEANSRKCAFLRAAARATGAVCEVHEGRIEDILPALQLPFEVVTARAVASLDQLLGWSSNLLINGAVGLFPKGRDVEVELTKASKSWSIRYDLLPSLSDSLARIVKVSGLAPRDSSS